MARIPVIIDTDPGVDDILAILLALASPELEILAFVISFGNTDREASHVNILKLFRVVARHIEHHPEDANRFPTFALGEQPFLAKGADYPLEGALHSAQYFHGRDGLGGIDERHPEFDAGWQGRELSQEHPHLRFTERSGAQLSLDLIEARPKETITYLALGPLTNLAELMRLDGETVKERIGRVVCMGGALDVPGNTNPVSEFNFFADPYAVKELLVPNVFPQDKFLLLPLDITTPHLLSFPLYTSRVDASFTNTTKPSVAEGKTPIVHFTSSFFERTREIMLDFGTDGMELHDIAAVWCAIVNPPGLPLQKGWNATRRVFDVERTGELTRGMLVVDRREDASAYAPGANRAQVQAELDKHDGFHAGGILESTAVPARVEVELPPVLPPCRVEEGVLCLDQTPGSEPLVHLLLDRVWGVKCKT